MANDHLHGSQGLLRFKDIDDAWVDLHVHNNQTDLGQTIDSAEDTGMSPAGRAKTHLLGLIGRTLNFTLMLTPDLAVHKKIDALWRAGLGTAAEWYPGGMVDGTSFFQANGTDGKLLILTAPATNNLTSAVSGAFTAIFSGDVTIEDFSD